MRKRDGDLAIAILVALVIMAGFLLVPVILVIAMPIVIFLGLVLVVWFSIKVFRDDTTDDTKGPG